MGLTITWSRWKAGYLQQKKRLLKHGTGGLTMADLIDRQAVIDAVEKHACNTQRILDAINALPPAQIEQKTGRWIPKFDGQFKGGAYWFYCSECGRIVPDVRNGGWSFCPQCGKKMRGDKDERLD
jgi:membrane protease subunit (stomatin/prohibitin family)